MSNQLNRWFNFWPGKNNDTTQVEIVNPPMIPSCWDWLDENHTFLLRGELETNCSETVMKDSFTILHFPCILKLPITTWHWMF
jgi:hypothetical protein